MVHEITVKSGTTVDTLIGTGGIFVVAYNSPADGQIGSAAIIRANPQDLAKALLNEDGTNGSMVRKFAESLCNAMYAILKRG
jgi:hypothetical protein